MALGEINPRLVTLSQFEPVVYKGRDNVVRAAFSQYQDNTRRASALDFSSVTRMVLVFTDVTPQVLFDSLTTPLVFDWSRGAGVVYFDLNDYSIPVGVYDAELVVYDADHTNGQVVTPKHGSGRFSFDVTEVYLAGSTPIPMPSAGEGVTRKAGEALSALRVVYESQGQVFLLDPLDDRHIDGLLGLTVTAAQVGEDVIVQRNGTLDNSGWIWQEGLVFLGAQGQLTQVPPVAGWELVVGNAPSGTRLNIDFDEPVDLTP